MFAGLFSALNLTRHMLGPDLSWSMEILIYLKRTYLIVGSLTVALFTCATLTVGGSECAIRRIVSV
jgi:hypothetical protein